MILEAKLFIVKMYVDPVELLSLIVNNDDQAFFKQTRIPIHVLKIARWG